MRCGPWSGPELRRMRSRRQQFRWSRCTRPGRRDLPRRDPCACIGIGLEDNSINIYRKEKRIANKVEDLMRPSKAICRF